jgi:DNA-binding CsgD family transcriptional regulator
LQSAAVLDRGAGLGLILYDVSSGVDVRLDALDGVNLTDAWKQAGVAMHADPRLVPGIIEGYQSVQCASFSELGRVGIDAARRAKDDYYDAHQMQDALMVNGLDCSGKGCSLHIFTREPLSLSDAERELYSLLAAHLTSAYRLQRRTRSDQSQGLPKAEAILESSGRVEHAEGAATSRGSLSALSAAVRDRQRARMERSGDPHSMLERRKALVMARWTLVEEYESDGQRFVLARVNAPETKKLPALSERERQVVSLAALGRPNKLIAYELGVAHSTVRVLIQRACSKLGVSSRAELIRRVRGAGSD